jgi:hypothetical protein
MNVWEKGEGDAGGGVTGGFDGGCDERCRSDWSDGGIRGGQGRDQYCYCH